MILDPVYFACVSHILSCLLAGRQAVTESVSTTLSEKFGRISLYVTDDAKAKHYVT